MLEFVYVSPSRAIGGDSLTPMIASALPGCHGPHGKRNKNTRFGKHRFFPCCLLGLMCDLWSYYLSSVCFLNAKFQLFHKLFFKYEFNADELI